MAASCCRNNISLMAALYAGTISSRLLWLGLTVAIAAAAGTGIRFISSSPTALNYSDLRYVTSAIAILLSLGLITKVLPLLAKEFTWLTMFVYALSSLAWVPNVTGSFLTYSGWVCVILVGALLAASYDRDKASLLVLNVMFWTSAVSLALIVLAPSIGRIKTPRPGGVIEAMAVGVFAWNSELSLASGTGAVLALGVWLGQRSRKRYFLQAALMSLVTVLSGSATGLLAMGAGMLATVWACIPKIRKFILILLVLVGSMWMLGGLDAIYAFVLSLVDRTPDLSGRSVIWHLALGLAAEQPVFGYGIGGTPDLAQYLGFSAHAHNGYIQLLLELGYLGTAIIGLGLLVTAIRGIKLQSPLLGVLTVVVVSNFANNYMVTSNIAVALLGWVAFEMTKSTQKEVSTIVRPEPPGPKKLKLPEWADRPDSVFTRVGAVKPPSSPYSLGKTLPRTSRLGTTFPSAQHKDPSGRTGTPA